MKTIGLFFSLLLIAFGLWGIIFVDFMHAVFYGWQDLVFYLIIATVVYFILFSVGASLNKKFNRTMDQFLNGQQKELFNDKKLLRVFGFLLIVLLPFLLFLQLLAVFAAIMFSLYGFWLISFASSLPIAIPIGLAAIAIGTSLAVIIGLYRLVFPKKRKTFGIELKENENTKLWELAKVVASEIKAKPINKIIITPDAGVGVYLEGSVFQTILGGGKRVLEIGLPSIQKLSVNEFKAILAHEYGHFSNADTQWSTFTFSMGNSLISTLRSTPGPAQDPNEEIGTLRVMLSLNPAYWILWIFVKLYFRVTNGFSRIREVMADIRAMNLYGGNVFSAGLQKIALNDHVFSEIVLANWVPKFLKEKKVIVNFSKSMDFIYDSIGKGDIENLKKNVLEQNKVGNVYDSHPTLKTRVDYAAKFSQKQMVEEVFVSSLFENWDNLNERAAELYNLRLAMYLQALEGVPKQVAKK